MFRNQHRKFRRDLQRGIDEANSVDLRTFLGGKSIAPHDDEVLNLARYKWRLESGLASLESNLVIEKAQRYGIEIPSSQDRPSWWQSSEHDGMTVEWLSSTGRMAISKLTREERRKNIEWWVKIVTPVLGALISLLGLVIALITILGK